MLKYEEARIWYYKAIEIKPEYTAPHTNLTDVYMTLKWSDEQIEKEAEKYYKINKALFYWQLGSAFYRK
jgi:hypothetical protein